MHSDEIKPITAPLTQYKIIVLLVDDQPIVGEQVRRMLAPEQDIVFHYCPDPTKAIPLAAEISPTVILQDLVMPEIDGLTLVKFFRAHSKLKDVPLIVLSTKEEAITKADAFAAGANDYLVKLPDRIELVARIRYHSQGYINLLQRNEAYDALFKSRQALAAELAQAAEYVISLLPPPVTEGPVRAEWRFVPSAQLGGDSLGYHWIDKEHFAMYLLDVCDHGVGPALLSVSALNVLRSQTLPNTDFRVPEKVLASLNDTFQMEHHNNLYFTIWYGVFNAASGRLTYASAGNSQAVLIANNGTVTDLTTPNMLIGGMPDVPYTSSCADIERPARLYIFSDGVYEVKKPDGQMWSIDEFKDFLVQTAAAQGSEMDALYTYLQKLQGGSVLDDDFSMLKIRFV